MLQKRENEQKNVNNSTPIGIDQRNARHNHTNILYMTLIQ